MKIIIRISDFQGSSINGTYKKPMNQGLMGKYDLI